MFSGIIECTGEVIEITKEGTNIHFTIKAPFTEELKVDQSIAHDGVCLTVTRIQHPNYDVTAIEETLVRSAIGSWKKGTQVNLERCLRLNDRLDGHMVQGHVDTTANCTKVENLDGSWKYSFEYQSNENHITVEKGSICINGVSLTVVDSDYTGFSVCIIPYTYEHTNFKYLQPGSVVNLEFDIIGKYVKRYMSLSKV